MVHERLGKHLLKIMNLQKLIAFEGTYSRKLFFPQSLLLLSSPELEKPKIVLSKLWILQKILWVRIIYIIPKIQKLN